MINCNRQGGGNMISKKTKIFSIENVDYRFDFQSFKIYLEKYADAKKTSKAKSLILLLKQSV